jgi:hypothetical protein
MQATWEVDSDLTNLCHVPTEIDHATAHVVYHSERPPSILIKVSSVCG